MHKSSRPTLSLSPQAKKASAGSHDVADHHPLRIMLVRDPQDGSDKHEDNLVAIRQGLHEAGYELVTVVDANINLPEQIAEAQPDMLIIESEAAARDLLEHVCVASSFAPRPIVLFTENDDSERIRTALAAGVTAYIVDGLRPERVKPVLDVASTRFQFEQALRNELDDTKNKLAERKQVERAKGVLMEQLHISEDEAYKKMRQMAMQHGIRIGEAAERILSVTKLLS